MQFRSDFCKMLNNKNLNCVVIDGRFIFNEQIFSRRTVMNIILKSNLI
jgi:hypothetical protein